MKLETVTLTGFRSVDNEVTIAIDPSVTVLIGANDHGKSNILHAITSLNPDVAFSEDIDRHWDRATEESLPQIKFRLTLDKAERGRLLQSVQELPPPSADPATPTAAKLLESKSVPGNLTFIRSSVPVKRTFVRVEGVPDEVLRAFQKAFLPRVELFEPQPHITDVITALELTQPDNEFMRGIFYYAGIDALHCLDLFEQTDATQVQLEAASAKLNDSLQQGWQQGKDLRFLLRHNAGRIELLIKDPAVQGRFVRASRRSSGFTRFFTLKTTLFARQNENFAQSHIYLFDEPGMFLHPAGQYDLMRAFDALAISDQVVYTTHSVFMINRTFPDRHRLIVKDNTGTHVDTKPYIGRWGSAFNALGVSFSGLLMFADHVVLCEGDSDAILLPALFQKAAAAARVNIDLNSLAFLATGASRDAYALIRILTESASKPRLLMLVDGDAGGKDRLKLVKSVLPKYNVSTESLIAGATIEDYLPKHRTMYVLAVATYFARLAEDSNLKGHTVADLLETVGNSFDARFPDGAPATGVARWVSELGKDVLGLESATSRIGIAREYIRLLEEADITELSASDFARIVRLVKAVQEALEIPRLAEVESTIFN